MFVPEVMKFPRGVPEISCTVHEITVTLTFDFQILISLSSSPSRHLYQMSPYCHILISLFLSPSGHLYQAGGNPYHPSLRNRVHEIGTDMRLWCQFIFESEWMLVPDVMKFPQVVSNIMHKSVYSDLDL